MYFVYYHDRRRLHCNCFKRAPRHDVNRITRNVLLVFIHKTLIRFGQYLHPRTVFFLQFNGELRGSRSIIEHINVLPPRCIVSACHHRRCRTNTLLPTCTAYGSGGVFIILYVFIRNINLQLLVTERLFAFPAVFWLLILYTSTPIFQVFVWGVYGNIGTGVHRAIRKHLCQ